MGSSLHLAFPNTPLVVLISLPAFINHLGLSTVDDCRKSRRYSPLMQLASSRRAKLIIGQVTVYCK